MQFLFDHSFGCQSLAEVYHFSATLVNVAPHEHDEALAHGWLATARAGQPHWYQCRSTRCDLSQSDYEIMPGAEILDPLPQAEMDHIYSAYCFYKRYRKYFEIGEQLAWDRFMGYRNEIGELIAWSKLRHYSDRAVETVLFAWDYRDPALRLGVSSLRHELAWARARGYHYVYMGPGYERMNRYKSEVSGFEWWTGAEWSQDREHYLWLCDRDSRIKSVEDLHDLQTTRSDTVQASRRNNPARRSTEQTD